MDDKTTDNPLLRNADEVLDKQVQQIIDKRYSLNSDIVWMFELIKRMYRDPQQRFPQKTTARMLMILDAIMEERNKTTTNNTK